MPKTMVLPPIPHPRLPRMCFCTEIGFVLFCDTIERYVPFAFINQTPMYDTDSRYFGGIESGQIEGEKPQDLTEFGLGNFTELLILVF